MDQVKEILDHLGKYASKKNKAGMARFGIDTEYALGVSVTNIRRIAKEVGNDHKLAERLWKTKIHEARILASIIDKPGEVTEAQMEAWVKDFNSWDLCDQCCMNLFDRTPFAFKKAVEWSRRKEEFIKRAGFALMATSALHNKETNDSDFAKLLPIIKRGSTDERNFVKKAVNWALRQIGKRNKNLNKEAIAMAKEIEKIDSKAARWVAKDALRELQGEAVQKRLK